MQKHKEQLEIIEHVHDSMTETLKQVVNEPSVGLYFVQEHVHKAVPTVLGLNAQLEEMTGDAELATADAKDCLSSLQTMKECGPPVIEHMIKVLNSASNTIPVRRSMRGSVSQLLPRPVRPAGIGRGPWRSSSFECQSESSKTRAQDPIRDFQKDLVLGSLNNNQISPGPCEPGHTIEEPEKRSTSFVLDAENNRDLSVERLSNLSKKDKSFSEGSDDSVSQGAMKDDSGGNASHYMRAVLDSAFSKAETVSREGAKLLRRGAESESGNNRLKSLLRFGRKGKQTLEEDKGELHQIEGGMSSKKLREAEDNLEEFKAEHAAKLEMWLSESDHDSIPVS